MKKRPLLFLILSIISLISLISLILLISPDTEFQISPQLLSGQANFKFQIAYGFFILLFLFFFSTFTYLLKSKKHGILIASFIVIYLIFRLNELTHPFFLILLAALFLTMELLVSHRK